MERLREGRLMIQRSRSTGRAVFPPRLMAPGDGMDDLEWFEPSGRGTVYSFTVVPQRAPREDYNVCLIELDEGVRILSRVVDAAEGALTIGAAVKAHVETAGDQPILCFRLAGARA
jgi:uncharacterized OB-fold protein